MSLDLPPLLGNMPVGFMAAVGLLRVVSAEARLSWDPITQCARLDGIDRDALLDHLVEWMKGRADSPELQLADDVRGTTPERYREIVSGASDATLAWVRALWREDGNEIAPTRLCLTGGPQRMIKMARELAGKLDPDKVRGGAKHVREKFVEALFGPWVYADEVASWGWDPATYRPGARTATEPSKTKLSGVAAAYWLAWESLPCFPNMPGRGTLGFEYRPKARAWTWTTWSVPLDIHAVGALLRRPEEGTALGGQQYRAGIVFAGQIQFFEPGRAF